MGPRVDVWGEIPEASTRKHVRCGRAGNDVALAITSGTVRARSGVLLG